VCFSVALLFAAAALISVGTVVIFFVGKAEQVVPRPPFYRDRPGWSL
jgi:hypothetical protein